MRKYTIFLLACCVVMVSCDEKPSEVDTSMINISPSASSEGEDRELPQITFRDTLFDFGIIPEGEKVKFTYNFENTGDEALIISKVEPSCGCTAVQDWSSRPYSPGEEGTITIQFDSNQRPGKQHKTISVITNCSPSVTQLILTGTVIGPESQ